jgi:hypothetical protein
MPTPIVSLPGMYVADVNGWDSLGGRGGMIDNGAGGRPYARC